MNRSFAERKGECIEKPLIHRVLFPEHPQLDKL